MVQLVCRFLTIGLLVSQLSACLFDTDAQDKIGQCLVTEANQNLYDYLKDWYLWEDDLPSRFDVSSHDNLYDSLNFLRDKRDRFSFVMTKEEYENYQASVFFGYGFSYLVNEQRDGLLIRLVYEEGSAAENGLVRGDTLIEVDGVSMTEILSQVASGATSIVNVFGPNTDGHSIDVKIRKTSGEVIEATFSKSELTANTVMAAQVKPLEIAGQMNNVAYLVFDSFDRRSDQELNQAFDKFKAEQVDEMILDLRYNTGGLIFIAKQLSTQIAGDAVENQIFTKYIHNKNHVSENRNSYFDLGSGVAQLNLDRVVVLTTGLSCSASELVINALRPFVDVVLVGERTCGKPVGMYPEPICDHQVFAINFETRNAADVGEYFDGLPVDCPVTDKVTGDWGVASDPLLSNGLFYLSQGQCNTNNANLGLDLAEKQGFKQSKTKIDFSKGPIAAKNLL